MVFGSDGDRYAAALRECIPEDVEGVIVSAGSRGGAVCRRRARCLIAKTMRPATWSRPLSVAVNSDNDRQVLSTSFFVRTDAGSERSDQHEPDVGSALQMVLACYPMLARKPPVLRRLAAWNHISGGTQHNKFRHRTV